ncbi:sensor histidine kinase [Rhodobacteraceae bacterium W635]|uniref:ATP-binding protein n=1 Tax=Nioella halotolerans TaxID=2303578 RepID=UPI000E3E7E6E|nr:sensor histidine kinase [Rhodobacteraceae bacterium W635]
MTRRTRIPFASSRLLRWLLLGLVLATIAGLAALPRVERYFLSETATREEATLRLATAALRGALSRTEVLPGLLAERPILARILEDPDNEGLVPFANEQLRQTALTLDVADIWVMDTAGMTIAASNYRRERSFVGRRFNYRPYFNNALNDGRGRFHALGTTSGQRGYYFAAPVLDGTEIVGVLAVKILLDGFEATWRESENSVIVTDPSNVIFLSDRRDWHFASLGPIPERALRAITRTRQYPLDRLTLLETEREALAPGHDILTVRSNGRGEDFVTNTGLIASAGWRVMVLTPTRPAIVQARQTVALAVLGLLFAGLIAVVFLQRRARLVERLDQQRRHREQLERRVADRTADLNAANAQLVQEVEERKVTEDRLRRTQSELVQAGKLAALGQMSAALSHEFNQPLAAVKAYADNAATFLDRDRPDEARKNIGLISQMADRMAAISKHLRNFARRPQDRIGPVPLLSVLDDVLELMAPKLNAVKAELRFERPGEEILVMGGRVRLQQVLVNLLSNALDAMERRETPLVEVSIRAEGGRRMVDVRDHGPGLEKEALAQLFDPFFSTKSPGKGLGLGLSISYNIVRDFGGTLAARNHPEGGAIFTVDLAAADPESAEAVAAQ